MIREEVGVHLNSVTFFTVSYEPYLPNGRRARSVEVTFGDG